MVTPSDRILQRSARLKQVFIQSGERSLTRRGFLAGSGAAVAASPWLTTVSGASNNSQGHCRPAAPRPIPGEDPALAGLGLHVFLPVPGQEPSTIFDFNGRIAIVDLIGDGVRTVDGVPEPAAFRADLRIIEGTYIGLDGNRHQNTFGFI